MIKCNSPAILTGYSQPANRLGIWPANCLERCLPLSLSSLWAPSGTAYLTFYSPQLSNCCRWCWRCRSVTGWRGAAEQFIVWTDHKNLAYPRGAKRLNSRQEQWTLFLGWLDFVLTYRPGSKNAKPDALLHQDEEVAVAYVRAHLRS